MGICPEKNMVEKDTRSPVFPAALLQQQRHGSNLNILQQMNGERRCGTHIQWNIIQPWKEWNNAICSNTNRPGDYHTKWGESRERQIYDDTAYNRSLYKRGPPGGSAAESACPHGRHRLSPQALLEQGPCTTATGLCPTACAPQQEKPLRREACTQQLKNSLQGKCFL